MAYSEYLEEHIQTELTKAIAAATIKNPKDAVDYIANYLLKIVDDDAKNKERKNIHTNWDKQDKELNLKKKEKEVVALQKGEEENQNKLKEEEFYGELSKCHYKTQAMQRWSEYIANKTKSVSVYIGSQCQLKQEDEDINGILYNAVSAKDNQFLMNTTFIQSETKGVVFDLLKEEENGDAEQQENDEENEEDENTEKKQEAAKSRQKIHIQNVLLPNPYKDKLYFFTYPKVGSFLSFQSSIKSYLNKEAIQAQLRPQWPRPIEEIIAEEKAKEDAEKKANQNNEQEVNEEADAAEKEEVEEAEKNEDEENEENKEEEEKQELPPDPPQTAVKYVISMDNLGDSQLYDDKTMKWIDENIGKFEEILMKIDINQYLKQREFETNLKAKLTEYEEKIKSEIDTKLAEIEKQNASNAEEIKLFKKYQHVIEATQSIWSLISDHMMKPQQSSFCRIIAGFVKLFHNDEENKLSLINNKLTQFDIISDAAWNQCINGLKQISSEKVNGFNPTEIPSFDISLFDKLLNGIIAEEIGNEGLAIIITMLYEFVDSSCKLYKFTEEEKKKSEEKPDEQTETE